MMSLERRKRRVKGPVQVLTREKFEQLELETRVGLIQQLIPLGLMAACEELQREVQRLAGLRHDRKEIFRAGSNPGTVKLGGQRHPIQVPRLRDGSGEVTLESYRLLHEGVDLDQSLLQRVLYGVSCRNYEGSLQAAEGAIGVSKSAVSRDFVAASSKELREFQERSLSHLDCVAIFLDGKKFAEDMIVIALGVDLDGNKEFLGFVETDTENGTVLTAFLRSLLDRGLDVSQGVLTIVDGAKGIRSAIKTAFRKHALVQRCQWHKRENVASYLGRSRQDALRKRLQKGYERPTYEEAKKALMRVRADLETTNQSAVASLDEGFEETLTLHRIGLFGVIGRSFKTTNCIENVNSLAEQICGKVDYWKNSSQKQRWLAATLKTIEPRLRKVAGYRQLPRLRQALIKDLKLLKRKKTST